MNRICISIIFIYLFSGYFYASASFDPVKDVTVVPLHSTGVVHIIASDQKELAVATDLNNGDVYVECLINGFTFSEEAAGMQHKEGEGHIRLYINGEHVKSLYEGAFILKGLPVGEHDIQVMIVKNDRTPYGLEESFQVHIDE